MASGSFWINWPGLLSVLPGKVDDFDIVSKEKGRAMFDGFQHVINVEEEKGWTWDTALYHSTSDRELGETFILIQG